jgi:6-pyruvoyltetrahydropterin/6-carboxytetrahydropterin synthase
MVYHSKIAKKEKKKPKFTSTKVFDGYSTVFRQWKAKDTHCSFLHGYGISFKLWFQGDLDYRNWVWDFGGMKRAKGKIGGRTPKDWFDYMFDHTMIVANDDPFKDSFLKMGEVGVAQVRVVDFVGAERFAEFIYNKVNPFVESETEGRVKIIKVEFSEHSKNLAIYEPGTN